MRKFLLAAVLVLVPGGAQASSYLDIFGNIIHSIQYTAIGGGGNHPYSGPNLEASVALPLTGLASAELPNANLSSTGLSGSDLSSSNLTNANLSSAILTNSHLIETNLTDANLYDLDLTGSILSYATLIDADLESATLTGASLDTANLNDATLDFSGLHSANFTGANLTGASLQFSLLTATNLSNTTLNNVVFSGSTFLLTNFSNAAVAGADFSNANLQNAQHLGSTTGSALYDANTDFSSAWDGANNSAIFDPVAAGWVLVNTAVPEPNTALLLGLGLTGLAAQGRRRRS